MDSSVSSDRRSSNSSHELTLSRTSNGRAGNANRSSTSHDQMSALHKRFDQERNKRIQPDGRGTFIDVTKSNKHKHIAHDIWAQEQDASDRLMLQDRDHVKVLVVGGGYGGLCFAVRSIQAGVDAADVAIVESAGGFGGAWYWNRYPGLMCDVESYVYMPLLEETGYIPKHKYAYGPELREHADRIARHWGLDRRGAFQQQVERLDWDEDRQFWHVEVLDLLLGNSVRVTANYVQVCPGILVRPKIINSSGVSHFKGRAFHTSRWDYSYTGGTPEKPSLVNLRDKRVGVIGTGASAVQAVPSIGRWAKELYVFQRTPASVHRRDQKMTDGEWFKKSVQTHPGWQLDRIRNFHTFTTAANTPSDTDIVNDGWTRLPQLSAFYGTTRDVDSSNMDEYIHDLRTLDVEHTERIHNRVDSIVHDQNTAERLKPWFPSWCKRATFHDDYLQAFNLPNVTLVDTDGKGVEDITPDGIIANYQEYPLDCIVFATGFNVEKGVHPARRAGISAFGRNGRSFDEKWSTGGTTTLHGLMTHDFPNMFLAGPAQTSNGVNFIATTDELAKHAAYIISTAEGPRNIAASKVSIEPTLEAEESWSQAVASNAINFAPLASCTPSYFNGHGDDTRAVTPETKFRKAKASMWGKGANDFARVLSEWREQGGMDGLTVTIERESEVGTVDEERLRKDNPFASEECLVVS